MQIHITLYGLLREKLPLETRGKTILDVEQNTTLQCILEQLGIMPPVTCAINGEVGCNLNHLLQDGDRVNIFRAAGGG